jgi:DNA/RNA endonuclease YhcR with UshA esterase domain
MKERISRIPLFLAAALLAAVQVRALTIYDVQYTEDPGGASPYAGQVVTVSGIVTAGTGVFSSGYYLQDGAGPWRGVYIYDNASAVSEGDSVTVTGEVSEYYGKTEIGYISAVTIHSSENALPALTEVETADLATGSALAESYEGVLVAVSSVVVTDEDLGYGEWEIDDGSGPCRVDDAAYSYSPSLGDSFLVVAGIFDYSFDDFKLEPRYAADIMTSLDGSGSASTDLRLVAPSSTYNVRVTIRPAVGELIAASVEVPFEWQWSGSTADLLLSGAGFAGASSSVTGSGSGEDPFTILVEEASLTASDYGVVEIRGITTPDSAGSFPFPVSTAGQGGELAPIATPPRILVTRADGTIPIRLLRENDSDGRALLLGMAVAVRGIVTVDDEFGRQSFLQDETAGVVVYGLEDALTRGDDVTVMGTLDQYSGLTELVSPSLLVLHTSGNTVDPISVRAIDIAAEGMGGVEEYEGILVRLSAVTMQAPFFPVDDNVTITDSTGPCEMRIDGDSELAGTPAPSGLFDVIGVVSQYATSSPYTTDYQLMPRDFSDIIKGGDGSGTVTVRPSGVYRGAVVTLSLTVAAELGELAAVSIAVPTEWSWSGQIADVSLGGEGAGQAEVDSVGGDGVDEAFTIFISGASVTASETMVIEMDRLVAPTTFFGYSFIAMTAAAGGALQEISRSPEVWVVERISAVQEAGNDGYSSAMVGQGVVVQGIVTGPSPVFNPGETSTSFWIQDGTGGVNIYSSEDDGNLGLTLGTEVRVVGEVVEYGGVTEVSYDDPADLAIIGTADLPGPYDLPGSRGIDEELEGLLVRIVGAQVATRPVAAGTGKNFQVWNDLALVDVRALDAAEVDLSGVEPGSYFDIVGVAGQYDTEAPYNTGYQVQIRIESDLAAVDLGQPSQGPVLEIDPNPFSPDLGEVATITVNGPSTARLTLRIYDLEGRHVLTPIEGRGGGPTVFEWRGTDEQGERVTIGIYLCHLTVVNRDGTTETKLEPVVVGTPLD